ncbi:MAG: CotH kinase family protein [Verrucomicrobia bacterium]|nr:CotH kinase family protein [Verrucomicrobiota bacterium]
MSSNGVTIADEDGDFEDWIELYNYGSEEVDLSGWGLSDDYDSPFKWVFPEGTFLEPGGFLLVWASGKDRISGELHTNFSISLSGEEVLLSLPDGSMVDLLEPRIIPRDVSVGRVEGEGDIWFYFDEPSPGNPNKGATFYGILEPPLFSHSSGFYNSLESLSFDAPLNAYVFYSLNGSVPGPESLVSTSDFHKSFNYIDPIDLMAYVDRENLFSEIPTNTLTYSWLPLWAPPANFVYKAVVVRARSFKEGYLPSPVVTATYFLGEDVYQIYGDLPIISLVSDYENLFSPDSGIYVPGPEPQDIKDQNFFQGWNRDAHLTFFESSRRVGFEGDFSIRIQGGSSPASPLKGLHVISRPWLSGETLNYPLFAGRSGRASEVETFRRFILRGWGSALNWPVFFSDAYHQQLAVDTGQDIQHYRPVVVFINGEYWGLQEIREYNRCIGYLREHHDLSKSDEIDVINRHGASEGDLEEWTRFITFLESNDLSLEENYEMVSEMMDVDNFIDYIVHSTYTGKRDWPGQNEAWWRARKEGAKWRWIQFDMDHGLGTFWSFPEHSMIEQVVNGRGSRGPHPVLVALLENDKFKKQFVLRYTDWMNSYLSLAREKSVFQALSDELYPYVAEHEARWPFDQEWGHGQTLARDIFQRRAALRPLQLQDTLGLQSLWSLNLFANNVYGNLSINSLLLDNRMVGFNINKNTPWVGNYYEDYPVTITAIPKPGHRFAGWVVSGAGAMGEMSEGAPEFYSTEPVIALSLSEDTNVEAVFEPIPLIELPVAVHVWDFEDAVSLLAPSFTLGGGVLSIAPGGGTVIEENTGGDFESQHLRVNNPLGAVMTFALPTSGYEQITLDFLTRRSGQGAGLMSVEYTTDGVSWSAKDTVTVFNAPPQPQSFDFSAVEAVKDNPNFAVRVSFAQGAGGTAGNNRFDDVVLSGIALPGTNQPPVVQEEAVPEFLGLTSAGAVTSFHLNDWFTDPNQDDVLTYVVSSSNPAVAAAGLFGNDLLLTPLAAGNAWITVSADDGVNPPVSTELHVLVYPAPFALSGGNYVFNHWSADASAGSFPDHMIFLQSGVSDPGLSEALLFAYSIAGDAHVDDDENFPYAATSRTRINGLGADGISFINTGRGRDVGSALLALDTSGVTDVAVGFTAGTVMPNTRIYAIRLQYRTALDADWSDVLNDQNQPVEYLRSVTPGDAVTFGPILLPAALEDQPLVQLQWRYYHVAGTSGARAMLRLDDVVVTSSASPLEPETFMVEGLTPHLAEGPLPGFTVRVVDPDGFTVTSFNGPVTLALSGDGTLSGSVTVNAVDGIAEFDDLVLGGAGAFTLTVSADGVPAEKILETRALRLVAVLQPRYLQGEQDAGGDNFNRIPVAFRYRIEGLEPGAPYRYGNRMALDAQDTAPDDNGAGNFILIPAGGGDWVRSTSAPRFRDEDVNIRHAVLTADENGVWEGWVVTEPSGNTRFTPGHELRPLIMLNDGADGEEPAWFLRAEHTVKVLELGTAAGQATAVYGEADAESAALVALYADSDLIALTHVEAGGSEFDDRYADFYFDSVAGHPGRWGSLIPNDLAAGIDRIEFLDLDAQVLESVEDDLEGAVLADGGTVALWLPAESGFVFLPGGDGRWDDPNHWMAPGWPSAPDEMVIIPAPLFGDRSVIISEGVHAVVGTLLMTNGGYRNRIAGPGDLTFDAAGHAAMVAVPDAGPGWAEFDLDGTVTLVSDLLLDTYSVEENPFEPEFGALRLRGTWQGSGDLVKLSPGTASLTGENKQFTGALRIEEGVLRITESSTPGQVASARVFPGGQLRLVSEGVGRVYDFGVPVELAGSGRNPEDVETGEQYGILGALRFDPFANDSEAILPGGVILAGGGSVSLHVDGTRNVLEIGGSLGGPGAFSKTGGGTLRLSGEDVSALTASVDNGTLRVDGSYPALAVSLGADGVLTGAGRVATASGSGSVTLGPGEVLTAQSVSGLSYRFRYAAGESAPILRLESETPFGPGFNSANTFALYLDQMPPAHPRFGFFSDASAGVADIVTDGDWFYYVRGDEDEAGGVMYQGVNYVLLDVDQKLFTARHRLDGVEGTLLGAGVGPAGYSAWAAVNLGPEDADGPTDNPFGTGPNLLKYALGLSAGVSAGEDAVWLGVDAAGRLFARFRRDPDLVDVVYFVEVTPDLTDWSDAEILYDSSMSAEENNDFDRMLILDDAPEGSPRFLRLRIMLPGEWLE